MRTTLNIDDEALRKAMAVSPGATKTAVINEALRRYARWERRKELLELRGVGGWEGDVDALRQRHSEEESP